MNVFAEANMLESWTRKANITIRLAKMADKEETSDKLMSESLS